MNRVGYLCIFSFGEVQGHPEQLFGPSSGYECGKQKREGELKMAEKSGGE